MRMKNIITTTFLRIAHYFAYSIVLKKAKINEAKKNMYDNVDVTCLKNDKFHSPFYLSQLRITM